LGWRCATPSCWLADWGRLLCCRRWDTLSAIHGRLAPMLFPDMQLRSSTANETPRPPGHCHGGISSLQWYSTQQNTNLDTLYAGFACSYHSSSEPRHPYNNTDQLPADGTAHGGVEETGLITYGTCIRMLQPMQDPAPCHFQSESSLSEATPNLRPPQLPFRSSSSSDLSTRMFLLASSVRAEPHYG